MKIDDPSLTSADLGLVIVTVVGLTVPFGLAPQFLFELSIKIGLIDEGEGFAITTFKACGSLVVGERLPRRLNLREKSKANGIALTF